MPMQIAQYSLEWHMASNTAVVNLKDAAGHTGKINLNSFDEFNAVSKILRNSQNVFFEPRDQTLIMAWTAVGS